MVEFPLNWGFILAGICLVLTIIFSIILANQLKERKKSQTSHKPLEIRQGASLLERIDAFIFGEESGDEIENDLPPVKDEENQQWIKISKESEDSQISLSLFGKKNILHPEELNPSELDFVKSMTADLLRWIRLPLQKTPKESVSPPAKKNANPEEVSSLPITTALPTPAVSQKNNPLGLSLFGNTGGEEVKPLVSIAVQINNFLQKILEQENYSGPNLYLTDNQQGDLVVVLGMEKFIGVDAVPDPEISALIKRAADQWTEQKLRRE